MPITTFTCSICGETSEEICVYCTKDTCGNHLCRRCHRCSDCCVCESPIIRDKQAEIQPAAEEVDEALTEPESETEPVLNH